MNGGGVRQAAYDEITWDGQERFTNTWFESLLVVWDPSCRTHVNLEIILVIRYTWSR